MPKSCLRCPTPPNTPGLPHERKCVAFSAEELERIYAADEWDRTPTEAAQKLSYGDILELKAIQRSLPIARQLPDPLARRPQTQYLQKVRIGLLPMYDDNEGQLCNTVPVPPIYPSNLSEPLVDLPPVPSRSPSLLSQAPSTLQPPAAAAPTPAPAPSPAKANLYVSRPKPSFAFIPLLESPAPSAPATPVMAPAPSPDTDVDDSDHDLSTPSLTNASLDTTPSPREHPAELDGADSYFQLPARASPKEIALSYFPPAAAYAPPAQSCYTPGAQSPAAGTIALPLPPSVQFKRKPLTPFRPPPPPAAREEDDDGCAGDCFMINGEKFHFGPASTPPDSPALTASDAGCERGDVPLSPLSPALARPASSLFAVDPPAQEKSQDLPPSLSRARPAPSIPSPAASCAGAYSSEPVIAPFCMQMKRAPRGVGIRS